MTALMKISGKIVITLIGALGGTGHDDDRRQAGLYECFQVIDLYLIAHRCLYKFQYYHYTSH